MKSFFSYVFWLASAIFGFSALAVASEISWIAYALVCAIFFLLSVVGYFHRNEFIKTTAWCLLAGGGISVFFIYDKLNGDVPSPEWFRNLSRDFKPIVGIIGIIIMIPFWWLLPYLAEKLAEKLQMLTSSGNKDSSALLQEVSPTASPNNSEDDPVELKQAIEFLQINELNQAFDHARIHLGSKSPKIHADANRICAIATARLALWDRSFSYWLSLFEGVEPNAHNALQLATTSVMSGELERGEAWFQKTLQLASNESNFNIPQAYINFISALQQGNHFVKALPYLEQIKLAYQKLHITDSTFLYLRGLPFFTIFLENSIEIVSGALTANQTSEWYTSMADYLDEEGKSALNAFFEKYSLPKAQPIIPPDASR